jgi:periplasmic protein TonB
MMLCYNVPFWGARQPAPRGRVRPLSATGDRWPGLSQEQIKAAPALGAALLLHISMFALLPLLVRNPPLALEPPTNAVAVVFFPASAPAAALDLVPPPTPAPPLAPQTEPPPTPAPLEAATSPALPTVPLPHETAAETPPTIPPPPREAETVEPPATPKPPPVAEKLPVKQPTRPVPPAAAHPVLHKAETRRQLAALPVPKSTEPMRSEPSAAPVPQQAVSAPIAGDWQSELARWLAAHKSYPERARKNGDQGRATVRFTVERDGRVMDVELVKGTGSTSLDDAARAMLQAASLPPFPPTMPQQWVTVTVQIRYQLTD